MTSQQREQTRRHETAHASAACCLGVPVSRIEVYEQQRGRAFGYVNMPFAEEMDADIARRTAKAILAGPLLDEEKAVPSWPLRSDDGIDEQLLEAFCVRAGIDSAEDYAALVDEVRALSESTRFRCIRAALTGMLEVSSVLKREDVRRAKQIAWGRTAAEEEEPEPEVDIRGPGPVYDPADRQPVMMRPGCGLTWRYAATDVDDYPEPKPYKSLLGFSFA